MDLKTLLADFSKHLAELPDTSPEQCRHLEQSAKKYRALKTDVKQLGSEKQALNAQFKLAKGDGEKLKALKENSKSLSLTLKGLEQSLKDTGNELLAAFSSPQTPLLAWPPRRFKYEDTPEHKTDNIHIRLATDADAKDWDAFVSAHDNASAYHMYQWRHTLHAAFGHNSYYLLAETSSGGILGVFPCLWLNSRVFGSFAASVPFFNYGGPLAHASTIENALIEYSATLAHQYQWQHIEIRTCKEALSLPSTSHKASMILALPSNIETLESDLGTKVRAQYNQTLQYSPQVKIGKQELLDDFYQVFAENMRDLGTPVYGKSFFAHIIRDFSEQAHIVVVYIEGKPAGTAFLLGYKDMLEIPWASTLRRYNRCNVNMWMYRQILGFAISQKFSYFDFGRSSVDAGTYRFKKQWGAKPIQHYWYYWLNEGRELPQLNPNNPKYKLAIRIWQKLPVFVTKLIGPPLVKFLP